jgi:hypothetical protein
MLPIDPHHPYASCGGPPRCRYCVELFTESPERQYARTQAEDRARMMRTAAYRASCTKPNYTPPDPYAAGLAKLRKELPYSKWPEPKVPSSKPSDTPPDPYKPHLDKMKGKN